jgi:hypothetical protein
MVLASTASGLAAPSSVSVDKITFSLFPTPAFINCVTADGKTPEVTVTVRRGIRNDHMKVVLKHVKPGLGFDLFTVERSNQDAAGNPVPGFTNFGLAWYQSDAETVKHATSTEINTILLDQIFGFDPDASLPPTQTLHVGLWFDSPAEAESCGFAGPPTPFNGAHNAGPVAFISRPDATTGLGPLCTNPSSGPTFSCNP